MHQQQPVGFARSMSSGRSNRAIAGSVFHRKSFVLFHAFICLSIAFAGSLIPRNGEAGVAYGLCVALTAMMAWSMWSWWWMTRALFDPYGMFMTSLFLFSAGQALLEVVGLNANGMLGGRFDDEALVGALYMVLVGVSFNHLGALLAVRHRTPSPPVDWSTTDGFALRTVGWVLLAVSIAPSTLLLVDQSGVALSGGYGALYQREISTGFAAGPQVLALFVVPAALFLLAGAAGRRREKVTAIIVIALHTFGQLFLGYRSTAIMPACAFLWLWNQCEGKIKPAWIAAAALFTMVVVVPISRETRALEGLERIKLETLVASYKSLENPIVSSISEMGGSLGTVAYTYTLVPASRAFDYGVGYAYATLTVLPNFFWGVHPTIAHGTASEWLVWTVNPYGASRQNGIGYSCIAEAYLNFGWLGVPIVMGLVGFGIAALTSWGAKGNRTHVAMVAVLTAFVLRFPRDESASLVRAVVWYSWLPAAIAVLIARAGRAHGVATRRGQNQSIGTGPAATISASGRFGVR
jgi:oligosaccharide repeat unit polymerase